MTSASSCNNTDGTIHLSLIKMHFNNVQLWKTTQTKNQSKTEKDQELTDGPLLIQTPHSKTVHQPDLVVLVTAPPGVLEDLDAGGQLDVVLVVISPASKRQLQPTVKVSQIIQIPATQVLQPAEDHQK